MKNLKVLEIKRTKKLKRERELEEELKEIKDEIYDLDVEISKLKGIPEDIQDISEDAKNITKNIRKRPRPSYKENVFNWEQDEHNGKRQKRRKISREKVQGIFDENTGDNSDDDIFEDNNDDDIFGNNNDDDIFGDNNDDENVRKNNDNNDGNIFGNEKGLVGGNSKNEEKNQMGENFGEKEQETENITEREIDDDDELEKEIERGLEEKRKDYKKRQSKREIENLLEELNEKDLEEMKYEKTVEGKVREKISEIYDKLCQQEEFLLGGKRRMMEIYFEFGEIFEKKFNILVNEEGQKEKTAVSKIIEEIMKGGFKDKRNIRRRSGKARKIYLIISAMGGKEIINRLKYLNSENYTKFSFNEIKEWEKEMNEKIPKK
jgi:hypothetical protein